MLFSPSLFLAFLTIQSASSTALCMICSILSGSFSSECVPYSFTNTQIQVYVHTSYYRCTASGTSDNGHFTNTQIQVYVHTSHYRCTASGTSDNGHFTNTQIQVYVHTSHYRCTASGTSDNGHSEKWTTSVERTN